MMEPKREIKERVKEVPPDPKKMSPVALVVRAMDLIAELKNRAEEIEEIKAELSTINLTLSELAHLSNKVPK